MNFWPVVILGVIIAIIALGSFVKKTRGTKKKTSSPDESNEVISPQKKPKEEKAKKTWGQVIKMWLLIIIFGIPITYFLALGMWGLVFKSAVRIYSSSHEISATMKWWKDPKTQGVLRSDGPFKTKIFRNNTVLKFQSYYQYRGNLLTIDFLGEKDTKADRFEGVWSQAYPKDGGDWYLIQSPNNEKLYTGKYVDKHGDWINFSLKIDPK